MRNIVQVTMIGYILDLFQSINIFALLNIISEDAGYDGIAKYCLATTGKLGYICLFSFHHSSGSFFICRLSC